MNESCIYKPICEDECTQFCSRYMKMKRLLDESNIPKSLSGFNKLVPAECDIEAYLQLSDIRDNIVDFVKKGKQLYLYSDNCGNGKTTWSVKLMLQYFNDCVDDAFKDRGTFINVNELFCMIRDSISTPNPKLGELKKCIYSSDLVIWDDIAMGTLSKFEYETLCGFINSRISDGKSNIFTSNISPNNLEEKVGERLKSRIVGGTTIIQFRGGDNR